MSRREVIAYAITHAPPGVKGGPYEAAGPYGTPAPRLRAAAVWPAPHRPSRHMLESVRCVVPHARVIRIVRKARVSKGQEASGVLHGARAVLAASGPDPMPVVRAAMEEEQARLRMARAEHGIGEDMGMATARAEKAERELRAMAERAGDAERERDDAIERADRAEAEAALFLEDRETAERALAAKGERLREERERDEARFDILRIARALGTVHEADGHAPYPGTADEMVSAIRSRNAEARRLGAELARLTAPAEGEPTGEELLERFCSQPATRLEDDMLAAYRLGVAHERARYTAAEHDPGCDTLDVGPDLGPSTKPCNCRKQPAQDRATDEELFNVYDDAYSEARTKGAIGGGVPSWTAAGILAVAERVRREQCLVARAVAADKGFTVSRMRNASGWKVSIFDGYTLASNEWEVPAADVPATLARLLGEVSP